MSNYTELLPRDWLFEVLVLIISWTGVSKVAGDCVIKYIDSMPNAETVIFESFQYFSTVEVLWQLQYVYLWVLICISTCNCQLLIFRVNLIRLPAQWWKQTSCHCPCCRLSHTKSWIHSGGGSAGESFMYNSEVCSVSQGTEAKSGLCSRSCRETGFTRGDIAPLAHPVSADFFTVFLWCKSATLMLFVFI